MYVSHSLLDIHVITFIYDFRWWKEGSEATISVGPQLNIGSAKVGKSDVM